MVHRLIYASKAAQGVTQEDFRAIAMFSAMRNTSLGITGLLMVYNDDIMQVLEGSKEAVQGLYERIQADPRHKYVKLLVDQEADSANFTKWSMGFRTLDSRADMDVFFLLSEQSLQEKVHEGASADVQGAVAHFKSISRLGQ